MFLIQLPLFLDIYNYLFHHFVHIFVGRKVSVSQENQCGMRGGYSLRNSCSSCKWLNANANLKQDVTLGEDVTLMIILAVFVLNLYCDKAL